LGTGIATYMAVHRPIEKLILVSPYDSIENVAKSHYWMIPVGLLIKDKYLSLERAKNITVPTLVIYAPQDQVVPAVHTKNLIKEFTQDVLTVVPIDNVDHGSIGDSVQFEQEVARFLHR